MKRDTCVRIPITRTIKGVDVTFLVCVEGTVSLGDYGDPTEISAVTDEDDELVELTEEETLDAVIALESQALEDDLELGGQEGQEGELVELDFGYGVERGFSED